MRVLATQKHVSLLVVNDGSTDSTVPIVRSLQRSYAKKKKPFFFVDGKTNRGYGGALELGIKEADRRKFAWVLFMDSDMTNDPSDSYVDLLCMDGYNWGNTNGGWQSFNQLFGATYNQLTALSNKDIFIGETASAEQGGSKANWITDAYGPAIDSMPKIMGINWFNANKEKDWRVNSTQTALNAYKQAIINSKY
jgi:glycosyltransferase involved in cell wall biosynthesis